MKRFGKRGAKTQGAWCAQLRLELRAKVQQHRTGRQELWDRNEGKQRCNYPLSPTVDFLACPVLVFQPPWQEEVSSWLYFLL